MTLTVDEIAARFALKKRCLTCKADLRTAARRCGLCEADLLEAIVLALTAEPPASTLAIWKLRDRGLTGRQVIRIRREVLRGVRPYEVVKAIEGLSNWRAA